MKPVLEIVVKIRTGSGKKRGEINQKLEGISENKEAVVVPPLCMLAYL